LIKDAWRTKNLRDKFRIWFMPTGWRPADVEEKYPVYKISDVYNFQKYDPASSSTLLAWSWFQLILLLLFVSYLFGFIAKIGMPGMFYYGGFIFLYVYALTELMDRNPYAWIWELAKNVSGLAIIYVQGDWFGVNSFLPGAKYFLIAYFMTSAIITTRIFSSRYSQQPVISDR